MKTVLVLGGSGCLANVLCEHFSDNGKYKVYFAGRNKPLNMSKDSKFIYYDMFDDKTYNDLKQLKSVDVVINTIGTAGKLSYDTTKIAQMNYLITFNLIDLAKHYKCSIIHVSSYKVGDTTRDEPITSNEIWRGPRSPYAWSKLAAENNLLQSKVRNVSLIRIGLLTSKHAAKFYASPMAFDGYVNVTTQEDFIISVQQALKSSGTCVIGSHITKTKCIEYHKSMYGNRWELVLPTCFFKIITSYLPHKMLDYADPDEHTYEYKLGGGAI